MDDSTKIAVHVIRNYLRDLERMSVMCYWHSPRFEQIGYEMIAAAKILNDIKRQKSLDPKTIIENFRDKMNQCVYMNEMHSRHFVIQADAATYILDEIIVYEERRRNQNGQNKIRKTNR